jgi:hypothetical protein
LTASNYSIPRLPLLMSWKESDEDLYKLFLKRNIEILNSLKNNVIENPQGKKCEDLTMIHAK